MRLRDLFSDDAVIEPQAAALDVKGLAVDSRAVKPGDLFFALAGSKTDGSRFIEFSDCRRRRCRRPGACAAGRSSDTVCRHAQSAPRAGVGGGTVLSEATRDHCRRHRHQRKNLGRSLHAPDLGAAGSCFRQHRHHRAGIAEAHRLRLADDAGSDRASQAARRNHRRRRHPSGVRSVLARARPVQARRRARLRRRLHQPVARPHGLSSDRRALPRRQAAAVSRSRSTGWRCRDLGRS